LTTGSSLNAHDPYRPQKNRLLSIMKAILFFLLLATLSLPLWAEDRPNIIYILADDLGYGDLSCTGQRQFSTPHLDQLAADGMLFTQHYAGSTVCAPSRSALMTGQHTGRTPIRGNLEVRPEGQYPLPADAITLPRLLKEAGYVTGAFGKWGLGYPGSEGDPTHHFDVFFGYNCQRLAHHYYPRHLWDNREKRILPENAGPAKGLYAPDLIHERTLQFIEENKDHPFFCFVPSLIPHAELVAPEAVMARFRGRFGKETPWRGTDDGPAFREGPYASQAEPRAAFAAMITVLDEQVGEIVAKVRELGIEHKTLIIFTSDNGPHREGGADPDFFDSNGPFRGFKRDLYEGGIRVPMIAAWPGTIPAGSKSDLICANWDLFSTVMELIGADRPDHTDGISLLPTLTGSGQQGQHSHLYWEFYEQGGRTAIRMDKWKGIRLNTLRQPAAAIALYDLELDPGETTDISAHHPEIVQQLRELFTASRTEPAPLSAVDPSRIQR
jgi:arylsulfatase A